MDSTTLLCVMLRLVTGSVIGAVGGWWLGGVVYDWWSRR